MDQEKIIGEIQELHKLFANLSMRVYELEEQVMPQGSGPVLAEARAVRGQDGWFVHKEDLGSYEALGRIIGYLKAVRDTMDGFYEGALPAKEFNALAILAEDAVNLAKDLQTPLRKRVYPEVEQ
jgi:hypothetical protein